MIQLQTERLVLEGVSPNVIRDFFNTKSFEEIKNHFGLDEQAFEHYKAMFEQGMETNRISLYFFLLRDKQTLLPIGECGFHTWNKFHRRAELFYLLRKDEFKNKGLMTEALTKVIAYGFNELNLHRIQGMVDPANEASIKLLLKNNFVKEGIAREDYNVNGTNKDSVCYSLLKNEWRAIEQSHFKTRKQ